MITTLALAAALLDPVCDWNHPGADPTVSDVRDTLRAMGIDSPELAAKVRTGDYSELVSVDRLDSRTWGMSSGDARWCSGEVDRHRWKADHAEQGRVYRVPGHPAVVWYWRCRNMSLWLPAEPPAALAKLPADALALPSEPTGAGQPAQALADPLTVSDQPETFGPTAMPPVLAGFVVFGPGPPCDCAPTLPPVAAVPEPHAAGLLGCGLLALWLRLRGSPWILAKPGAGLT